MEKIQTHGLFDEKRVLVSSIQQVADLTGQAKLAKIAVASEQFHKSPRYRFSLFQGFIQQIRSTVQELDSEMNQHEKDLINGSKSFFKIWSALNFAFCTPSEPLNRECFGESLAWAGYIKINRKLYFDALP